MLNFTGFTRTVDKTEACKLAPIGVVMLPDAQAMKRCRSIWTESGTQSINCFKCSASKKRTAFMVYI